MNRFLSLVVLINAINFSYADVYQWTDKQGIEHFSDTPFLGAKKLIVPMIKDSAPKVDSVQKNIPWLKQKNQHFYTHLAIIKPNDEATIRNNYGSIIVKASVKPYLFSGDKLQIIFDGAPLGTAQRDVFFHLKGIYRGAHQIKMQIINKNGDVIKISEMITVFMFRPIVGMRNKGKN